MDITNGQVTGDRTVETPEAAIKVSGTTAKKTAPPPPPKRPPLSTITNAVTSEPKNAALAVGAPGYWMRLFENGGKKEVENSMTTAQPEIQQESPISQPVPESVAKLSQMLKSQEDAKHSKTNVELPKPELKSKEEAREIQSPAQSPALPSTPGQTREESQKRLAAAYKEYGNCGDISVLVKRFKEATQNHPKGAPPLTEEQFVTEFVTKRAKSRGLEAAVKKQPAADNGKGVGSQGKGLS